METYETQGMIWLSQDGTVGSFVLDFGCGESFSQILLRNCHNAVHRDRSTKDFRLK